MDVQDLMLAVIERTRGAEMGRHLGRKAGPASRL